MADRVASHYSENLALADVIAQGLRSAGKDLNKLTTTDLATVDEFHIRGRKGTLELAGQMNLNTDSHVLDIGSGLGGPARTLAETYGLPDDWHRFDPSILRCSNRNVRLGRAGQTHVIQARGRHELAL